MTRRFLLAGAAALALTVACRDASGPVAGALTVQLETPHLDDGALVLTLSGPGEITEVTAAGADARAFAREAGGITKVAVFGALAAGPVLRFAVPDVRKAGEYVATVVQVADRSNDLRPITADYRLKVAR